MCNDCEINTAPCADNTTEFEDWVVDGLKKAEEMLEIQVNNSDKN